MAAAAAAAAATSTDSFDPKSLRVLVVDDDPLCLMILERMLKQCSYTVTTTGRATDALKLLRESRDKFDMVISDVHMPDMDGFKLLELIGLEMDLPVIMMSANGETSAVMKGITHGACDYLLKPVRIEELRNIWQHVLRKKTKEAAKEEHGSEDWDDNKHQEQGQGTDGEYSSKKRKEKRDGPLDDNPDEGTTLKKPRVVWSIELHQRFVNAVNKLGIEKAVPKKILEIMNVQGLTRENVASHLQKYRLYLKRLSGVDPASSAPRGLGDASPFGGNLRLSTLNRDLAGLRGQAGLLQGLDGGLGELDSSGLGNIDMSTLAILAQLQALQQRQSTNATLGGLSGMGDLSSAALGAANPLQGLSSYDLNVLMQAQQETAVRQRLAELSGAEDLRAALQGNSGMGSDSLIPNLGRNGGLSLGLNSNAVMQNPGAPLQLANRVGLGGGSLEEELQGLGGHGTEELLRSAQSGGNDLSSNALLNQLLNQQSSGRPKYESLFPNS